PEVTGTNGCESKRASDTVYVGPPPPWDASAISLLSPVTGINLGDNMVVSATIQNLGTLPMTNFPVYYSINNHPPVCDTVTLTIQPGNTLIFTFDTTADLSNFGTYTLSVWTAFPGDTNQLNDTVKAFVVNKMYTYCYSGAIASVGPDIGNFTIHDLSNGNPTPVFNNVQANGQSIFFSWLPPVILRRSQSYTFSISPIYSSAYSECYAKVYVDWNYDGVFYGYPEPAFTGGPTSATNTVITGSLTVPANAHLGVTLMRVVLVETGDPNDINACGDYPMGETEDYLVMVKPLADTDMSITAIVTPPPIYPANQLNTPRVKLTNNGYFPITSASVTYQLDNDPPVTITWSGNLASTASVNVNFPAISWPEFDHTICAWVSLPGDTNYLNDTLCANVTGVRIDNLPYYDNFDGPDYFTIYSSGQSHWARGAPTPALFPQTAVSPPDVWAVDLNHPPYADNAYCTLTTQLFDVSSAAAVDIQFWIKYQTEPVEDGCLIEYSADNGNVWLFLGYVNDPHSSNWFDDTVTALDRPGWTGNSPNWKLASYRFINHFGIPTMRFRFRFAANSTISGSGIAIDNFSLTVPVQRDAGVDSILYPQGQALSGTSLAPKVRLRNFGATNITSVDLSYSVNNGPPVTETWTGTLLTGLSVAYQFTTPYVAPTGNYELKAYTSLTGDLNHLDDTSTLSNLYGIPIFIPPYEENFNSAQAEWHADGTQWEHGTPTSAIINSAYSPPYCWKTNLDGPYSKTPLPESLYSPLFNLSAIGNDQLEFEQWVNTNFPDGGKIEYLSTTGWKTLGSLGDPFGVNWYNHLTTGWTNNGGIDGWHQSSYDLSTVSDFALPTQFRFTFTTLANNTAFDGWAVDNFRIGPKMIPEDAGVTAINLPSGPVTYGTGLLVDVNIKNFGTDTLYYIPVKYQINGITVNLAYWTGILLPDSTTSLTFTPIPSPLDTFSLCVYTDMIGDDHYFNDTLCLTVPVVPPLYDLTVSKIIYPAGHTMHGDSATVVIRVKNLGMNPVSSFPLGYTVADTMTVVSENCQPSAPLNPGDSLDYTFIQKYYFNYLGYYYLCVFTALGNDGYTDNDGLCVFLDQWFTGVPENESSSFILFQNTPNPADNTTQVRFMLPRPGSIEFGILDVLGQSVIRKQELAAEGEQQIEISTRSLAPGMYYYYLIYGDYRQTRKMMVAH
ncbi:MAG: GEVED domain-containing protein, partial [Bacteroidetes bacterium]|nr:GEVED domain-containing protein [Bacteroidota bacterium]